MRKILVCMLMLLLCQACTKRELGGVATVSALLLAVPLVPFAEAYHVVNDTKGKAKQQQEIWRAQFDPVYAKRAELIALRDPKNDADYYYASGSIIFFPSMPTSEIYPGLSHTETKINTQLNQARIAQDETLSALQQLLSEDPLHTKTAGWKYTSDTLDRFEKLSRQYKTQFNVRMAELSVLHIHAEN